MLGSGCGEDKEASFFTPPPRERDSGPVEDGGDPELDASKADSGGRDSGPVEDGGSRDSGAPELPSSPDNPWIAFARIDMSGFGQLYFVKADGSELVEYGGDSTFETDPAFSPDGKKLAFSALSSTDGMQLRVLDFDAGKDEVLATGLETVYRTRWTADGTALIVAGSTEPGGKTSLYRIDAASGGHEALTAGGDGDSGHDLAPSGLVYFVRKLGDGMFDVFSIAYDAGPDVTPNRVTNGSGIVGGVTVHPSGKQLLFARGVNMVTTELIERTLADKSERKIGDAGDEQPTYFSGGDKLAINRDSFGSGSEIAVTDTGGALLSRCTNDTPRDTNPTVSPLESDALDVAQFQ